MREWGRAWVVVVVVVVGGVPAVRLVNTHSTAFFPSPASTSWKTPPNGDAPNPNTETCSPVLPNGRLGIIMGHNNSQLSGKK